MEDALTHRVLMVRPKGFGLNRETLDSNAFIRATECGAAEREAAAGEFEGVVGALRDAGVEVVVAEDATGMPDAIFPNNWFTWHAIDAARARVVLYPMMSELRRQERSDVVLETAERATGVRIDERIHLERFEQRGLFLEGTGAMVLDRPRRHAYVGLSPRAHDEVLEAFCDRLQYRATRFHAADPTGQPIYHTNVMLALGASFAILCEASIGDPGERKAVREELERAGRACITISFEQMAGFAANLLHLASAGGGPVIAMSAAARDALTPEQRRRLEQHGELVSAPIPTIERVGGGSVRCMLAELGRWRCG